MSMIIRESEPLGKILHGTGLVGLAGISIGAASAILDLYRKVGNFHLHPDEAEQEESIRDQYLFAIRNLAVNVSIITWVISKYFIFYQGRHKPAAFIAGIPLGTVEELSHAMSHELLKYRSKAGVFLAHQPGGNQTLRISGKAIGLNRYIFLIMIDLLFRYGNSRMMDLFLGKSSIDDMNNKTLIPHTKQNLDLDPWKVFDEQSLDVGRAEYHYTFPVITRQRIYTNMYIETYEFTESIENGMDVISFTIFFRRFEQPYPYKYSVVPGDPIRKTPPIYFYKEDYRDSIMSEIKKWDNALELSGSLSMIFIRIGMMLTSNTPERTLSVLFGMRLGAREFSIDGNVLKNLSERFEDIESGNDIISFTVQNKEELMQID